MFRYSLFCLFVFAPFPKRVFAAKCEVVRNNLLTAIFFEEQGAERRLNALIAYLESKLPNLGSNINESWSSAKVDGDVSKSLTNLVDRIYDKNLLEKSSRVDCGFSKMVEGLQRIAAAVSGDNLFDHYYSWYLKQATLPWLFAEFAASERNSLQSLPRALGFLRLSVLYSLDLEAITAPRNGFRTDEETAGFNVLMLKVYKDRNKTEIQRLKEFLLDTDEEDVRGMYSRTPIVDILARLPDDQIKPLRRQDVNVLKKPFAGDYENK